jgi:restriction system protein
MTVPTYDQFIEPLLRFLAARPDGVPIGDACEGVANTMKLSPEDRAEILPSGRQAVFRNRIGWAHDRLKRAGHSESPRRGLWRLTSKGVAFAKANKSLREEEIDDLATVDRSSRLRPKNESDPDEDPDETTISDPVKVSPEERIEAALEEVRESVSRDLLENIGRAPPEFFEHLVLDLLHAMGYGTSRSDLQRVGGSGDGGIDGIISLDRLGLEKVYIQAKRWKSTIGSPDIQGFMGALQLQAASKGVFITTSNFTKDARQAARRARGTIVLVDGKQLSALMIEHGVGVSHKALKVPKVDSDYFEDA